MWHKPISTFAELASSRSRKGKSKAAGHGNHDDQHDGAADENDGDDVLFMKKTGTRRRHNTSVSSHGNDATIALRCSSV